MRKDGIKVIGAGAPRTATASLMEALEILGFGPCYHMFVNVRRRDDKAWYHLMTGDAKPDLAGFEAILEQFSSCVDFPTSALWPELIEAYPNAKVVLTVRDENAWAKSMMETAYSPYNRSRSLVCLPWNIFFRKCAFERQKRLFNDDDGGRKKGTMDSQEQLAAAFKAWNQRVIDNVPKDKLLVFQPKDGWEPLCKFLGVSVPDVDFPKGNATEDFQQTMMRRWRRDLFLDIAIGGGALAFAAGIALALLRRK